MGKAVPRTEEDTMTQEKGLLLEMLRRMLRIRHFEYQVVEFVARGEMPGAPIPTSARRPWQ